MLFIRQEVSNDRFIFTIENKNNHITYEQMVVAITSSIQPDVVGNDEITSWTQGFVFVKDDLEVFFYDFYDANPNIYIFELLQEDIAGKNKLKLWLERLIKIL